MSRELTREVGRGAFVFLRRDFADRQRRVDGHEHRLPRVALRQGRRRLSQSAADAGRVLRFHRCAGAAQRVPTHSFERFVPFEGCMPIEEMADRGKETLAFGPMRAVGLIDPRTGNRPYAVVQLRQENREQTLYNLVGFQTKMTYPEQRRVFALIPGSGQRRVRPARQLAPQHVYQRAAASDADAAMAPARVAVFCRPDDRRRRLHRIRGSGHARRDQCGASARGAPPLVPPPTTALGALLRYITDPERKRFQPMNVNFGLLPPLSMRSTRQGEKRNAFAARARRLGGMAGPNRRCRRHGGIS